MSMLLENLMELDCSEIDGEFLPDRAFVAPILTPISSIAPPQGSPFLERTNSMRNILKFMPSIYR
ncbi:MAG: hypothetical protein FWE23_09095 [Chitinivibrionia bacterium]|nr:hypothetical protein [Chitinivibrionia bacterium]